VLKLGITTPRGLRRPRTWLGRPRHASFLLLGRLATDAAVAPEAYDALIRYAPMPNGTWKFTQHGRLAAVDAALMAILRRRHALGSPLVVCDLAASTGATSLELYEALRRVFAVDFVASDLYRDLLAVRSLRWPVAAIFDARGRAVQYLAGPFVLSCGRPDSVAHPVNRVLARAIGARFAPAARAVLAGVAVESLEPFAVTRKGAYDVVRLPILTRDVLRACAAPDFRFEAWDALEPLPLRAHVVRAMNIFTRDHFGDDERRRGLRHCVQAVQPGGLLVVGWSPYSRPTEIEASIYRVDDGGLTRLHAFNGGSEIDGLLASMFPVAAVGEAGSESAA
jgi:hypothetical protein